MKIFYCGKLEEEIDLIPTIGLYLHYDAWDFEKDKKLWHAHFCIQWIKWYFEIKIGKDGNN